MAIIPPAAAHDFRFEAVAISRAALPKETDFDFELADLVESTSEETDRGELISVPVRSVLKCEAPTGVYATMFAFVAGALCPLFDTPIRSATERHDNLKRYVGRMTARFYPDVQEVAGVKAAA